ncbi:hypothetical protein Haur_5063 (plasmid) [Herpetosiphon aurantiacus DSM 785]|uniref:Uncharacterized protein n=1 Tax=Herpetosiphon aurantiacus (strain ATCC 23779 / DSM 785 / 114-95) TaxID=316274 RepID=A9B8M7_HERA2|nr:hypothetical protein Haur_5063 [Herpetosiphon aurantiacus DSM 785]
MSAALDSVVVLWTVGWAVVTVLALLLRRWLVTRLATGVVTLPPPPLGSWLPTQDAVTTALGPWLAQVGVPPLPLGVWLAVDWSRAIPAQIPVTQGVHDEN